MRFGGIKGTSNGIKKNISDAVPTKDNDIPDRTFSSLMKASGIVIGAAGGIFTTGTLLRRHVYLIPFSLGIGVCFLGKDIFIMGCNEEKRINNPVKDAVKEFRAQGHASIKHTVGKISGTVNTLLCNFTGKNVPEPPPSPPLDETLEAASAKRKYKMMIENTTFRFFYKALFEFFLKVSFD